LKKLAFLGGAAALGTAAFLAIQTSHAADHVDSTTLATSPMADINDVLAWTTSDASKVNLVMTVAPFNNVANHSFGPSVQYVFHVHSKTGVGAGVPGVGVETQVICTFASNTSAQCWVKDAAGTKDYASGDPSATTGLTSRVGKFKVFAGPRSDPFFFNLQGFRNAGAAVQAAVMGGGLTVDAAGCPNNLDDTTVGALRAMLGRRSRRPSPLSGQRCRLLRGRKRHGDRHPARQHPGQRHGQHGNRSVGLDPPGLVRRTTMKTIKLLSITVLAATSCGDNLKRETPADAPRVDAPVDALILPAAPTLGTQIERMGRPAVNTSLNASFFPDTPTNVAAKKDAYNQASNPATWGATMLTTGRTVVAEFMSNLAVIDVLDQGEPSLGGTGGCGNQVLYNGDLSGGGSPAAASYAALATILADDMLYVDTSKGSCLLHMALELDAASGGQLPHTQCGGRTPSHDVIDLSYSMLSAGVAGFDPLTQQPKITDGAAAHTDIDQTTFPFLGAPH